VTLHERDVEDVEALTDEQAVDLCAASQVAAETASRPSSAPCALQPAAARQRIARWSASPR